MRRLARRREPHGGPGGGGARRQLRGAARVGRELGEGPPGVLPLARGPPGVGRLPREGAAAARGGVEGELRRLGPGGGGAGRRGVEAPEHVGELLLLHGQRVHEAGVHDEAGHAPPARLLARPGVQVRAPVQQAVLRERDRLGEALEVLVDRGRLRARRTERQLARAMLERDLLPQLRRRQRDPPEAVALGRGQAAPPVPGRLALVAIAAAVVPMDAAELHRASCMACRGAAPVMHHWQPHPEPGPCLA
mmetsp:Transcript_34136/g.95986  ORF Transcript_34136/g.95986 Transcript_34136/m.95986 type:complete len:249 (+) Transcript_34136:1-747(+)